MTENGDPLENPIAERINGILKEEYLDHYEISNLNQAKQQLTKAVNLYNNERPHMSLGNFTPSEIHQSIKRRKPDKLWKNYYTKKLTIVNPFQD
jgi:putative transposase